MNSCFIDENIPYHHILTTGNGQSVKGCCASGGRYHWGCDYDKYFANDCEEICSKDQNCKGYSVEWLEGDVGIKNGICRTATTSPCDSGRQGKKMNVGTKDGELGEKCVEDFKSETSSQGFKGCYVKRQGVYLFLKSFI